MASSHPWYALYVETIWFRNAGHPSKSPNKALSMTWQYNNLINGQWTVMLDSYAPNTNQRSVRCDRRVRPGRVRPDVQAVAAAAAFPAWSTWHPGALRRPGQDSHGDLARRRSCWASCWPAKKGKTLPEAIGEVGRAGQIFKFFCR